jgi:hypothetical protein
MDGNHDLETITLIDRLKGYWMQKGVKIRPGLSLRQIESFLTSDHTTTSQCRLTPGTTRKDGKGEPLVRACWPLRGQ